MLPSSSMLFVLFGAGLINCSRLTLPAELVPRSLDIIDRAERTGGGWSLSASTCPDGTSKCGIGSWCCPSSFICMNSGDAIAEVCCPGEDDCVGPFELAPFCADVSWSLWNATDYFTGYDYFCCLSGQTGLQDGTCASNTQASLTTSTAVLVSNSAVTRTTSTTSTKKSTTSSVSALTGEHTTSVTSITSSLTLSPVSTSGKSAVVSSQASTTAVTSQNGGVNTKASTTSSPGSASTVAPSTSKSGRLIIDGENTGIFRVAFGLIVCLGVGIF